MQMEFTGPNVGIFVLGRGALLHDQTAQLSFDRSGSGVSGCDFWVKGLEHAKAQSRSGNVAVLIERKNEKALEAFSQEKIIPTQIIKELALEGYGTGAEFRKLARGFIRQAKDHHCDVIYFPESIFGEESTQKALQQLAGTQVKVITLTDVFEKELQKGKKEDGKRTIKISDEFTEFEKKRAAEILQTKLPIADDKQSISNNL